MSLNSWKTSLFLSFGFDPLKCSCGHTMTLLELCLHGSPLIEKYRRLFSSAWFFVCLVLFYLASVISFKGVYITSKKDALGHLLFFAPSFCSSSIIPLFFSFCNYYAISYAIKKCAYRSRRTKTQTPIVAKLTLHEKRVQHYFRWKWNSHFVKFTNENSMPKKESNYPYKKIVHPLITFFS